MLDDMASGSGRAAGPRGAKAGAPKTRSASSATAKARTGTGLTLRGRFAFCGERAVDHQFTVVGELTVYIGLTQRDWCAIRWEPGKGS